MTFTTFKNLVRILKNSKPQIIIEDRLKLKYRTYGMKNHAEFIGLRNQADGDLWDAIIPGYKDRIPPHKKYIVTGVYGILLVQGGNHKVAVKIRRGRIKRNEELAEKQIQNYIKNYKKGLPVNVNTEWIEI